MLELDRAVSVFRELMAGYRGFWCVAGGWAIDLALNKVTRSHEDLEIVVLRSEAANLFQHFASYAPMLILTGGEEVKFVPWAGEAIPDDVIQIRLNLKREFGVEEFDLLLTPSDQEMWICRRDERLRLPLEEVTLASLAGIPVLRPEIVLLFKAKYVREKDQADFSHAWPALAPASRAWLHKQLRVIHPNHQWLSVAI